MLEHIDKIIEFVTMLSTILFVICRSNANVKKKIDEHLKPNGGSSVRDVLDRIEATQRAFLELQEGGDSGHFLADKKGNLFWVSHSFSEIMGLEREDCLGIKWITKLNEETQDNFFSKWSVKVASGQPLALQLTTGKKKNILFRSVPILDNEDLVLGFIGSIKTVN